MSSNAEHARGLVLINGRAYPAKEVLAALERQAMTSLRVVGDELFIGNERVRPLLKTSAEQAMMLTCFGSLAFCCDLARECHLRDEALRLLGMTKEEYRAIQRECHQQFLRYSERRWPEDSVITSSPEPSSSYYSSYSRSPTVKDEQDLWRDPVSPTSRTPSYSTSRSSSSSSSSVELGGLFDSPSSYSSTSPEPQESYSDYKTRPTTQNFERSPDSWDSSPDLGSTLSSAVASPAYGFCIYCGQDLQHGSEFCSRCGRSQK